MKFKLFRTLCVILTLFLLSVAIGIGFDYHNHLQFPRPAYDTKGKQILYHLSGHHHTRLVLVSLCIVIAMFVRWRWRFIPLACALLFAALIYQDDVRMMEWANAKEGGRALRKAKKTPNDLKPLPRDPYVLVFITILAWGGIPWSLWPRRREQRPAFE